MEHIYDGGCLCGAVRYSVSGKPAVASACHCRYCQRRTGSAFATLAYFDEAKVKVVKGELAEYEHRSDESGRWLRTQFCPRCGTTVTIAVEVRPGMKGIALGTLDDPDALHIERHIWLRSKRPWVVVPADVATFPRGSVGATPGGEAKPS
jgi:hypothetical protein